MKKIKNKIKKKISDRFSEIDGETINDTNFNFRDLDEFKPWVLTSKEIDEIEIFCIEEFKRQKKENFKVFDKHREKRRENITYEEWVDFKEFDEDKGS